MKRLLVLLLAAVFTILTIGAANAAPDATPTPSLDSIRPIPPATPVPSPSADDGSIPLTVPPNSGVQVQRPPGPPPTQTPPSNEANQPDFTKINPAFPETLPEGSKLAPVPGHKIPRGDISASATSLPCGAPQSIDRISYQECDRIYSPPGIYSPRMGYEFWVYNNNPYTVRVYWVTATIRDTVWTQGSVKGPGYLEAAHQYRPSAGDTSLSGACYIQTAGNLWTNRWGAWAFGPTFKTPSCGGAAPSQ